MKRIYATAARILLGGISLTFFSSCDGIFDQLYDVVSKEGVQLSGNSIRNVNVTSYTQWTYIDFHTQTIETRPIDEDGCWEDPEQWDIAIHRWDARTHGGAALETGYASFDDLYAGGIPSDDFVEDVWTTDRVAIDMSEMMSGVIGYTDSYYNEELSKWIHVDTSEMPPIYTLSNKLYLVRLSDDTYAGVILTGYMDDGGAKGYLTIKYLYPVEM